MTNKKAKILLLGVFAVLVLSSIVGFATEGNVIMGCPEPFFDAEKGCQIAVLPEYTEEYALVREEVGEKTIMGCPERFFDAEKGCQTAVLPEYTEEYALVREEVGEKTIMGCPENLFDPERGCQIPIWK